MHILRVDRLKIAAPALYPGNDADILGFMFFFLSKFLAPLLSPLTVATLLLTGAMIAMREKRMKLARRLGIASWAVLIVFGVLPVGQVMIAGLESRYSIPAELPRRVDGIIVLGGMIDTDIGLKYGVPQLQGTVDRLTTFVDLGRRYPSAKLVFTSGIARVDQKGIPEGQMARQILENWRFTPGHRLVIEDKSRNTYENALFSRPLAEPKEGQTWLLVTSASHMPRAVGVFEKQNWRVVPVPADFQSDGKLRWGIGGNSILNNMMLSYVAIKEYAGIAAYALTGKWSTPHAEPQSASLVR